MKKLLSMVVLIIGIVILSACSTGDTVDDTIDKNPTGQKDLTIEELAEYDGKDGMDSYIAVNGLIYDVTGVAAWSSGSHNGGVAGTDVSELINSAPHGNGVLDDLEIIGDLIE